MHLSLWLSLWLVPSLAFAACFSQSPFVSTCEPAATLVSPESIRGCFRPDLLESQPRDAPLSISWNPAIGVCIGRLTSCDTFAPCSGLCFVSCKLANQGFLVMSLKAEFGVKSFALIDTPSSSNRSVQVFSSFTPLPTVFRANALDQLPSVVPSLKFKEMVVTLLLNNSVGLNVTFDLSGSPNSLTRTNWFSTERLKSSWPVSDIKNRTFNFLSIPGDAGIVLERRFYINYFYSGCPLDSGLMVALDAIDDCPWGQNVRAPTKFLYCTQPGQPYTNCSKSADAMAIVLR